MQQPESFMVKGNESMVLRLKKALYGFKQAPRAWYQKLHNCLISLGFTRSQHEQGVYLKKASNISLILGVYVDDLIIIRGSEEEIQEFKGQIVKFFEMSDLGLLSSYLGIEVRQMKGHITLSQSAYAQKILDYEKMRDCKPIHVPLEARLKFSSQASNTLVESTYF